MNKMSSVKERCRNWTPEETEFFADVLADENNRFAKASTKKSSQQRTYLKSL